MIERENQKWCINQEEKWTCKQTSCPSKALTKGEETFILYSLYYILHFVQLYNLDLQPRNLEHTRKQSALDHFSLMYQKWRDKINKIKDKHRYFSHNWGSTVHTHTHTQTTTTKIYPFFSFFCKCCPMVCSPPSPSCQTFSYLTIPRHKHQPSAKIFISRKLCSVLYQQTSLAPATSGYRPTARSLMCVLADHQ